MLSFATYLSFKSHLHLEPINGFRNNNSCHKKGANNKTKSSPYSHQKAQKIHEQSQPEIKETLPE